MQSARIRLQYKSPDTKPVSLLLYRNWRTPYLICAQPADVSCEVLPTALSLSYWQLTHSGLHSCEVSVPQQVRQDL